MKLKLILMAILSLTIVMGNAQITNPKEEVKKQGTNNVNNAIEEGVGAGFNKVKEGIGGLFKKKKKSKKQNSNSNTNSNTQQSDDKVTNSQENKNKENKEVKEEAPKMNVQWAKFDFVPGDEVIFEDGPSIMEENGEFPSRWDLVGGQVEIANVNGENVIMFIDGSPKIVPYLKNSKEDYLPDVFTVEFDMYRPGNGNRFQFHLNDVKNQRTNNDQEIEINYKRISPPDGNYVEHPNISTDMREKGRWIHISLAYTKGKLKIYMDDTRLINIPHYEKNPSGISIGAYFADMGKNKAFYLKNVRIAKGGVKYYDRVMSDGKIICNGIRFDVGKATLKPESMGPINKIFQLMQKQPDLKFSVEGHTDSDGDDATNQKLSEARAKTVMEQLITMGIAKERLAYKGFGEKSPLGENSTPEGKANNRRVEFVKF